MQLFKRVSSFVGPRRAAQGRRRILSLTISLLGAAAWTPSQAVPPGLYEITTETLMPHLEENLRYANKRKVRCIGGHNPSEVFPILRHQSLNGCKLGRGSPRGEVIHYPLICHGSGGMKGTALLNNEAGNFWGELRIQMGGKNMTFSQRITATRQGDCDS